MTDRLKGKVAILTGAAGGIGSATARLFAAEGAALVLADLDEAGVKALAGELGPKAVAVAADVAQESAVKGLVDTALARFGRLDVLHNNAVTAFAADTDPIDTPNAIWQQTTPSSRPSRRRRRPAASRRPRTWRRSSPISPPRMRRTSADRS